MNVISFPALDISLNISPVAFCIGGKEIYWYAIIILVGFLLAVAFCTRSAKKNGINPDYLFDIALYGLVFGIVCARIYYVIFDFETYRHNLLDIFKIWEGGLAIYGGIIGGIITAYAYCRLKKLNIYQMFDIAAPGMLIGQAVGRYGNFFNVEVYGRETSFILGMSINGGAPVHPLFFYESAWNVLGLIILLVLGKYKKAHGQIFYGYILWYSLGRLILEGMRRAEYVLCVPHTAIPVSQLVAVVFIVVSVFMLIRLSCKNIRKEKI